MPSAGGVSSSSSAAFTSAARTSRTSATYRASRDGNWVYFLVAQWDAAQELRTSLGLPPKDFHVTIAFNDEDIHGVPKGASSVVAWPP